MVGEVNYGIIDPNMPAKIGGSFQQGQANALAMQQAQQEGIINALKIQQAQSGIESQNALNRIYQEAGGDTRKAISGLKSAGQYGPAMELEKGLSEQDRSALELKKSQLDLSIKNFDYIGQALSGVKDQSSYEVAKQHIAQTLGPQALANIPANYDPVIIQQKQMQALPMKEQLAEQHRLIDDQLNQAKFGYQKQIDAARLGQTERHFQAGQSLKQKELALKGAEIGGAVAKGTREVEMKLADDYRTESKGFAETSTAMKKVLGAIDKADVNPASAMAAGTAFAKLLDPQSVVRETELGMVLGASGWFDRATNITNTLQSGRVMTKTQQANLKKAADDLFSEAKAAQREVDAAYKKRAEDYGANPERVIISRGQAGGGATGSYEQKETGTTHPKFPGFSVVGQ